jgi:hypothetical protein
VISEDAREQKPAIKKRTLVASMLLMAAVGTHWLPGRTIVARPQEPQQSASMLATDKLTIGPNSLLGDTITDNTSAQLASNIDLNQYHMDVDSVVDQAGLSKMLDGVAPLSNSMSANRLIESAGSASAVPEPRAAGILLLAAMPVLVRRKARPQRCAPQGCPRSAWRARC